MSNCVDLWRETVVFLSHEIKLDEFKQLVQTAPEIRLNHTLTDLECDQYEAWWFLQKNTVFHPDGWCAIRFGRGRSSHTWRDLQGTLSTIAKFMKRVKHHKFVASDESDGHAKRYWLNVEFKGGKIK